MLGSKDKSALPAITARRAASDIGRNQKHSGLDHAGSI
jgi:hypothetical protein